MYSKGLVTASHGDRVGPEFRNKGIFPIASKRYHHPFR